MTNTSLEFPHHCNKTIIVNREEKSCQNSVLSVTALHGLTKEPINETVVFSVPMNGNYSVGVKAEGFEPKERTVNQEYDHDNCAAYAPNLVLHPKPKFCPEKKLLLVV